LVSRQWHAEFPVAGFNLNGGVLNPELVVQSALRGQEEPVLSQAGVVITRWVVSAASVVLMPQTCRHPSPETAAAHRSGCAPRRPPVPANARCMGELHYDERQVQANVNGPAVSGGIVAMIVVMGHQP